MALSPFSVTARSVKAPSTATLSLLSSALRDLRISQPAVGFAAQHRNASHQAQGRANGAKDGAGRRLGAKKTGGEYVIPGNILFKQRGTLWFPGDGCFMGRDHTIHAGSPGYVRYYRDPIRHPKRKYIGIVFEKDQVLPQPTHAVRRRKLGMLAYQMPTTTASQLTGDLVSTDSTTTINEQPNDTRQTAAISTTPPRPRNKKLEGLRLTLRPGYQYRQSNHEIGRSAERKEAEAQARGKTTRVYSEFKPGDRFAAWRKSSVRIARNNERRLSSRKGGKKR